MEPVFVILDEEQEYVSRLLRYISSKEENEFEIAAFTSRESFLQYGDKRGIGLFLCEETLYGTMEEKPGCPTVLLSSRTKVREGDGPPVIYKFQSAQEIFSAVLGYYRELAPQKRERLLCDNARIVTVCSVCGGSGVSTLAYTLAKKKAKGERVIFLSLDPFFKPERSDSENQEALTSSIYFIRQNSAKFSEKLKLKTIERVDCLYGVQHWADISECSREDMIELLRQLAVVRNYESVIIDAGGFTAASAGCMEQSDTVILVSKEGKYASEKEKAFFKQAKYLDENFEEKVLQVFQKTPEKMAEEVLLVIG